MLWGMDPVKSVTKHTTATIIPLWEKSDFCVYPAQMVTAARLAENGIALFTEENWTAVFSSETDRMDETSKAVKRVRTTHP